MPEFHADGTLDCACGMVLHPVARVPGGIRYECANRDRLLLPEPSDSRLRRAIANWIDRKSGQLDVQHRRWSGDEAGREE